MAKRKAGGTPWPERIQWVADEYYDGSFRTASEKLGLGHDTLGATFRRRGAPTGETLEAIALRHRDINPAWLVTGTGPRRVSVSGSDPATESAKAIRQRVVDLLDAIEGEFGLATSAAGAVGKAKRAKGVKGKSIEADG